MRHRIYFHIVWTTRDRAPLIDLPRAQFLSKYLTFVGAEERIQIWSLGIVATHLHLLVRTRPVIDLPWLVQRFKGGSATVAAQQHIGDGQHPLRWAKGYNVQSVSHGAVLRVAHYVDQQSRRHPGDAISGWRGASTSHISAACIGFAITERAPERG